MIKKGDMEFAMKLGLANAESVVMYHGAKNKLLTYKEALETIKRRPLTLSQIIQITGMEEREALKQLQWLIRKGNRKIWASTKSRRSP